MTPVPPMMLFGLRPVGRRPGLVGRRGGAVLEAGLVLGLRRGAGEHLDGLTRPGRLAAAKESFAVLGPDALAHPIVLGRAAGEKARIVECAPKGKPQLGNEARVAEALERLAERLERAEKKRAFGRKVAPFGRSCKLRTVIVATVDSIAEPQSTCWDTSSS